MTKMRPPAVAGQFYPHDPLELRNAVESYIAAVPAHDARAGFVVGGIVPHAGYIYSGATAAYTYRAIQESDAASVVLVGPSHRDYFESVSVYDGDVFETPLGPAAVDAPLARQIARSGEGVMLSDLGHRMEHALEVQVPFLQTVLPKAKIVPITMGIQNRQACEDLAVLLSKVLAEESVILLASSDLSHFYPYDTAVTIDRRCIDLVGSYDARGFLDALVTQRIEACGGGPVAVVMLATHALGATRARVLRSCNSGDVSGDRSSVVGYMSAVFERDAA